MPNSKPAELELFKPKSIYDVLDRRIFGKDLDGPHAAAHREYIESGRCYEWYYALGKYYQPATILEIGVRFGYSACAMVAGADKLRMYEGWDWETYEPGCLAHARANLNSIWLANGAKVMAPILERKDSQTVKTLGRHRDMFHVDAAHDYAGALHDMELALVKRETGYETFCRVMLVDDYSFTEVKQAVDEFVVKHAGAIQQHYLVDTFRGLCVVEFKGMNTDGKDWQDQQPECGVRHGQSRNSTDDKG